MRSTNKRLDSVRAYPYRPNLVPACWSNSEASHARLGLRAMRHSLASLVTAPLCSLELWRIGTHSRQRSPHAASSLKRGRLHLPSDKRSSATFSPLLSFVASTVAVSAMAVPKARTGFRAAHLVTPHPTIPSKQGCLACVSALNLRREELSFQIERLAVYASVSGYTNDNEIEALHRELREVLVRCESQCAALERSSQYDSARTAAVYESYWVTGNNHARAKHLSSCRYQEEDTRAAAKAAYDVIVTAAREYMRRKRKLEAPPTVSFSSSSPPAPAFTPHAALWSSSPGEAVAAYPSSVNTTASKDHRVALSPVAGLYPHQQPFPITPAPSATRSARPSASQSVS